MGLDFIRAKGERFEGKCDRSKLRELDTEDLLSQAKPDLLVRHYQCRITDTSAELIQGCALIAQVKGAVDVIILQHARPIGHMIAEDAADFTTAMRKNHRDHGGGVISLTIMEAPNFDGIFTVKPKRRFKQL